VREYLLTEREKQIIRKYIETGEKLEGFRTLLTRCRHIDTVQEDLNLIKQLFEKAGPISDNR